MLPNIVVHTLLPQAKPFFHYDLCSPKTHNSSEMYSPVVYLIHKSLHSHIGQNQLV